MKMDITKENALIYSEKYDKSYNDSEDMHTEDEMKKLLRKQRCLTRDEFIKVAEWKSKRP